MNTLLFYPHEIDQYISTSVSPSNNTVSLEIPSFDIRGVHIRTVLRAKIGDALSAGVVNESMGTLVLSDMSPTTIYAEYQIAAHMITPVHSTIIILLAHPRPPVTERLLRDLTTMGVSHIIVYAADLSERSYLNASLWKKTGAILLSGAMQGNINRVPILYTCLGIENALSYANTITASISNHNTAWHSFVFDHNAQTQYSNVLYPIASSYKSQDSITSSNTANGLYMICAIGPERGHTEHEYAVLQRYHFLPVTISRTVLRTETAAILAVGMWNSVTTFT